MTREHSIKLMRDQIKELLPQSTRMKVIAELENGVRDTEKIARNLGIAGNTVRRHIRAIARDGTLQLCQLPETVTKREADLAAPNFVMDAQIDVLNQLKDANEAMWDMVERLEGQAEDRGVMTVAESNAYIRALGEVRQQLQLQANLVEMMLRVDTIKEFQMEVLATIEEIDPIVAQKIKVRLIEKRAMRSAISNG